MANKYESIFIIDSGLDEEATKGIIEKFKGLIESSAALESIEEWGKRKLAYPIEKVNEGYYVMANFSADSTFIHELERVYKITDGVVKYIVINKDK